MTRAERRHPEKVAVDPAVCEPAGRKPPTPTRAGQSLGELEPWLEAVDEKWPDRQWPNREARRRQAIILWRTAVAEIIADAMRNTNEAGE